MDALDLKVIQNLMRQARMTWSELAAALGLSAPAAADRVRRLEDKGVIQGYATLVDPTHLGLHVDGICIGNPRPPPTSSWLS